MAHKDPKKIWTIGHSTHDWVEFIDLLAQHEIRRICDVRSMPGSRKFPQYNQDNMKASLPESGIEYLHMPELGGRRKKSKFPTNTTWRNASFQNYADYMQTDPFQKGISNLEELAAEKYTCLMCAEAVWWRCHRSMIADCLKFLGWTVLHIMSSTDVQEHPYTEPARAVDGALGYGEGGVVLRED